MGHPAVANTPSRGASAGQKPAGEAGKSSGAAAPGSRAPGAGRQPRNSDSNTPETAEGFVVRFLRALQAQQVAIRIYQKNHALVLSAMEATEFHLRAALDRVSPIAIGVENGVLVCCLGKGAEPLVLENKKVWAGLAENWTQRGLISLVFTPQTNLGELDILTRLLNGSHPRTEQEWQARMAEDGVVGIRANVPMRQPQGTILATLVSALIAHGGEDSGAAHSGAAPATMDDLTAALCLVARFEPIVRGAARSTPQHTAGVLHLALADAERRTLSQIVRSMSHNSPRENEAGEQYLARLAESLLIETLRDQFLARRLAAQDVRGVFSSLSRALARAMDLANDNPESANEPTSLPPALVRAARALLPGIPERGAGAADASVEKLHQEFWTGLPAREKSVILRGPDAWCVPVPVVRRYLDQLLSATRGSRGDAPVRESRIVIVNYARGLESEQGRPRRTVANGLIELMPVIEKIWPTENPGELGRASVRALVNEVSPGIGGILAALVENLTRLAITRGDYVEFERVLTALDSAPRDSEHSHLVALGERIMDESNWGLLVTAALAANTVDASLPRLLRRDPERLLKSFGTLLAEPDGLNALPAMARLTTAAGEAVLGALELHLYDPRRQRAATAIKLLAATEPQRLVSALPRALAGWDWNLQDLTVAGLTARDAEKKPEGVARAFVEVLREAHPLVAPAMLDEIGLARELSGVALLCEIAEGALEQLRDVFIRIKAIEALGRMRATSAAPLLRTLLRSRQGLVHTEPVGLRVAAEEALALIENHPASVRLRASKDALEKASIPFARPRRYFRIPLDQPYAARIEQRAEVPMTVGLKYPSEARMELRPDPRRTGRMAAARVRSISLGGAFLESSQRLTVGDHFIVEIRAGLRHIRSTAVVRNVRAGGGGVEFLSMKEDSRERLRRLVRRLVD